MTAVLGVDEWGTPMAGADDSIAAWDRAWRQLLSFTGDPFDTLDHSVESDDEFVLGPVFVATYLVLGASRLDAPAVRRATTRAGERIGSSTRERGHVEALDHLVVGDFGAAATVWDRVAHDERDFAAVRFAHDVYLHIGDAAGRLRSSRRASELWPFDEPGGSYVAGQYAFALEESGEYERAERMGRAAMEADPDDLWARHALAHVYESTDDQAAAIDLLEGSLDRWSRQDALATHMWWHLALRYLAAGDTARVLDVHDRTVDAATTPFRLGDVTSLLWRLELAGHDVGDRWDRVADRWAALDEHHTCAFIDLHAAMAFARRPDHPAVPSWMSGVEAAGAGETSANAEVLRGIGRPLVEAFMSFGEGDHLRCRTTIDTVTDDSHRIGGSVAQRDVITLTRRAAGGQP